MAYDPPLGSNIVLALSGSYVPPAGDAIILGGGDPPEFIPYLGTPGFAVPWGQLPAVDRSPRAGWKDKRPVCASIGMGWVKRFPVEAWRGCGWRDKSAADSSRKSGWSDLPVHSSVETASPWRSPRPSDREHSAGWDALRPVELTRRNASTSPPPMDRVSRLGHATGTVIDRAALVVPWGNPPPKDHLHRTVWGRKYYQEICWRHYQPPPGCSVNFNIDLPITLVDDEDRIRFRFDQYTYDRRCSWREPSGWRDPYFYRPPGKIPSGPWATVYTMLNTSSLTRLPERTPIEITSMTISTDWDSLYWTIKATVGRAQDLTLLEPTEDGPMLVEAAMNGHLWKLQVDKWATGHAFGQKSRSIDGRSLSAQLGAPLAEIRTYTETGARTAAQLVEFELLYTGWAATLEIDDWLVPGNVHSYQDQAPMQVIKAIADTCRAMVQTHMTAQTLAIKPRYKVKPWMLATATPDVIIPAAMTARIDGQWDERPRFNSVYVSGEAGGISATITREGTAGDLSAPMITSKLITAVEPARALGIAVLGGSGRWSTHRIELPVFAPPAVPGIILPGWIIEYDLGSTSWRGFVSAVSATSQRTKEGLKVRQTIDVERYHGD